MKIKIGKHIIHISYEQEIKVKDRVEITSDTFRGKKGTVDKYDFTGGDSGKLTHRVCIEGVENSRWFEKNNIRLT